MEINNEQLDTLIQLNLLKENYNLLLEEEKFNLKKWFKEKLDSFVALAKSIPDKIRNMINKCKQGNKKLEGKDIQAKEVEIKPGKKIKVTKANIKSVCNSIITGIADTGKNIANIIQSAIKICKYAITRKNWEELESEKKKLAEESGKLKERFSILNIYHKAMRNIYAGLAIEADHEHDSEKKALEYEVNYYDKKHDVYQSEFKKAKKEKNKEEENKYRQKKDYAADISDDRYNKEYELIKKDRNNPYRAKANEHDSKIKRQEVQKQKAEDDPRARVQKQIDRGDKAIEDMKDLNKKAKENIAKHKEFLDKRKKDKKIGTPSFDALRDAREKSKAKYLKDQETAKEKFEKSAKQPGSTLKSKQDIDNFFVGPNTSSEDFDKAMRNKNTRLTFK